METNDKLLKMTGKEEKMCFGQKRQAFSLHRESTQTAAVSSEKSQ